MGAERLVSKMPADTLTGKVCVDRVSGAGEFVISMSSETDPCRHRGPRSCQRRVSPLQLVRGRRAVHLRRCKPSKTHGRAVDPFDRGRPQVGWG